MIKRTLLTALPLSTLLLIQACGSNTSSSFFLASADPLPGCQESNPPNYDSQLWFLTAINATNRTAIGNGTDVQVRVVDSGVQYNHCDLEAQVSAENSYDLRTGQASTATYSDTDAHGTAVAGLIAASNNGMGGTGVAPQAKISGYNLLDNNASDANTLLALSSNLTGISVLNNSWGPFDDGLLKPMSNSVRSAIDAGVESGRNGLGSIYIWAAGNGGSPDNSNYDGYPAYRKTMAVAALLNDNTQASYSENGANLWISAPAGPSACNDGTTLNTNLITTDLTGSYGYNSNSDFTTCFSGTSGAAPLVSGSIALMLAANANLGWRDVYEILARSATKNNSGHVDWQTNAAGLNFNHSYGFGMMNTQAAVEMAQGWTNISSSQLSSLYTQTIASRSVIDHSTATQSIINIADAPFSQIEHVEINIDLSHAFWRDLTIQLIHTDGTTTITSTLTDSELLSNLLNNPVNPNNNIGVADVQAQQNSMVTHTFTANAHFLDNPNGTWTLRIQDESSSNDGTFNNWKLTLYGR